MYRLLGFQSVTNARLLLNHRKLVESQQSFSLLFNSKSSLLKPKCEWDRVKIDSRDQKTLVAENLKKDQLKSSLKTGK